MRTAISIPDKVFQSAEALAVCMDLSRSELYAKAIEAFIKAQKNQSVTETLNEIYTTENNSLDDLSHTLQTQILDKGEW